jgi:hypothetical protein
MPKSAGSARPARHRAQALPATRKRPRGMPQKSRVCRGDRDEGVPGRQRWLFLLF